jgi:hypothetical protein
MISGGVQSLDVELQAFLTSGLEYVRQQLDASIQEIFTNFTQPHLAKLYGQKEIDNIKKFIRDNEIPVVQSWMLNPERVPQISIHLAQSNEFVERSTLGDYAQTLSQPVNPVIIIPKFVPKSFDKNTGIVTVPSTVDLTALRPGYILIDGKGEPWLVTAPISANSFALDISDSNAVSINSVYIQNFEGIVKAKGGQQMFQDTVQLGIHGQADTNMTLWMYYIVAWILFKFKPVLEKRGIQLQSFSGSEFTKDASKMGEMIYSRWMTFSAITTMEWTEEFPTTTTPDGQFVDFDFNSIGIIPANTNEVDSFDTQITANQKDDSTPTVTTDIKT